MTPFSLPTKISHLREENASRYNYRGSQKPNNYLDGSYQNCPTFPRLQAFMIDTNDRCCGSIIIFSRRRVTSGPSTTSCSPMYHWRPIAPRSTGDTQLHPNLPVTTDCTPIYPSQPTAPQSTRHNQLQPRFTSYKQLHTNLPSANGCTPIYPSQPTAPQSTRHNQLHPNLPVTTNCKPDLPVTSNCTLIYLWQTIAP